MPLFFNRGIFLCFYLKIFPRITENRNQNAENRNTLPS